jgi:hypothetical protein
MVRGAKTTFAATSVVVALYSIMGIGTSYAADLVWEVENPFRFFKRTSTYEMFEKAFAQVRGTSDTLPPNIIWRVERKLNDPDCKDSSSPMACAATARANYETSRMGWAAQTVGVNCYDRNARPRHYMAVCERQYSWGVAKEDYVLPEAHTVVMRLSPERLTEAGAGECTWTWQPRRPGSPAESHKQLCKDKLVIKRVPFALDRALSGVSVKVRLPNGNELVEPNVVVDDVFLVALGDSFASGESNPDRPVVFSAAREMVYDPVNVEARDHFASRGLSVKPAPNYGLASSGDNFDPKSLPKRIIDDEEHQLVYAPTSREFLHAFEDRSAQWLSADCHRSQYGYPFRVGIELTLENRHRAVSFVSLACSGSDIVEGLFQERDARERFSEPNGKKVLGQFDALSDLICRGGSAARTRTESYTLPVYSWGSTQVSSQTMTERWCPPESRKRPIDLVLMSIGGNDVGFSSLVLYTMTNSADDLAPIAGWIGQQIRFGPDVSRSYLNVLDKRFKAIKAALQDGFGVEPSRVLQNAYEPIQFDETGAVCGAQPTLGMDVHPKFAVSRERVTEVANFARELQTRLECITDTRRHPDCPAGLATGTGTGFGFVTDHLSEFGKRGICARDPARALVDQVAMGMPRKSRVSDTFEPYSPANTLPYAHHWRLIRNPNDAFLAANLHREGISPFDLLQPAYAALYSGAFHPSAEGHSIVADHVIKHAREILERRNVGEKFGALTGAAGR